MQPDTLYNCIYSIKISCNILSYSIYISHVLSLSLYPFSCFPYPSCSSRMPSSLRPQFSPHALMRLSTWGGKAKAMAETRPAADAAATRFTWNWNTWNPICFLCFLLRLFDCSWHVQVHDVQVAYRIKKCIEASEKKHSRVNVVFNSMVSYEWCSLTRSPL